MAFGLLLLPVGVLFMLVSGPAYLAGLVPFLLLLLSQMLYFALAPLRDSLLYFYARPDLFFALGIVQIIIILAIGVWLVPAFGLSGAALAALAGQLFFNAACVWCYHRISRPKP